MLLVGIRMLSMIGCIARASTAPTVNWFGIDSETPLVSVFYARCFCIRRIVAHLLAPLVLVLVAILDGGGAVRGSIRQSPRLLIVRYFRLWARSGQLVMGLFAGGARPLKTGPRGKWMTLKDYHYMTLTGLDIFKKFLTS